MVGFKGHVEWNPQHTAIYTFSRVRVARALKGGVEPELVAEIAFTEFTHDDHAEADLDGFQRQVYAVRNLQKVGPAEESGIHHPKLVL